MKSEELGRVIASGGRLDPVQRLDIYANMYFWRLLDILRGDFSAVVAAVGEDAFHNLVTDYLSPVRRRIRRCATSARGSPTFWRSSRSAPNGRGWSSWRASSGRASSSSTDPTPSR